MTNIAQAAGVLDPLIRDRIAAEARHPATVAEAIAALTPGAEGVMRP